jgi:hypothetical protein
VYEIVIAPAVVVDEATELIVGALSCVVASAEEAEVTEVALTYAGLDELAVIWT